MNSFEKYLDILPEIRQALNENKPVVALESTILSHGMPYPEIKIQTYLWKAHRPVRNIHPSFHYIRHR